MLISRATRYIDRVDDAVATATLPVRGVRHDGRAVRSAAGRTGSERRVVWTGVPSLEVKAKRAPTAATPFQSRCLPASQGLAGSARGPWPELRPAVSLQA